MKYFVLKSRYFSTDWQDWRQTDSYLGSEETKYEFVSKDDAKKAIIEDVNHVLESLKDQCPKFDTEEVTGARILELVNADEQFLTKTFVDADSEESIIFKCEDPDVYELMTESCYSDHTWYIIFPIEDSDIMYVPVRNYLCLPKLAPRTERIVSAFTDSFERALETKAPAYMDKKVGFYEYEDFVLIASEKKLKEELWYNKQLELLLRLEAAPSEMQHELFHPLPIWQKENLDLYDMKKENKNDEH